MRPSSFTVDTDRIRLLLSPMTQCKRCLDLHGPGCVATHETGVGDPTCAFCLDGVKCPVQQKRERVARLQQSQRALDPTVNLRRPSSGTDPATKGELMQTATEKNGEAVKKRICKKPNCTTELGPGNRSGNCRAHCHYGEPKAGRSNGNGHRAARPEGANGHADKERGATTPKAANGSNGSTRRHESVGTGPDIDSIREDRLDRLILSLTIADKAKIAAAWLRGEI
jgi:hypothetical protein